jgi:hypothetical protein
MAYPRPYRRPDGGRRHANFYYFAGPTLVRYGSTRGRAGEALHPDREPLDTIERIRRTKPESDPGPRMPVGRWAGGPHRSIMGDPRTRPTRFNAHQHSLAVD